MTVTSTAVTLSYLVAGGQLGATALIAGWVPRRWRRWAAPAGWLVLGAAHGTLVTLGWTSDLDGFRVLQPVMVPLVALSAVKAIKTARATSRATDTANTTSSSPAPAVEPATRPAVSPSTPGEMRTFPYADHPDADLARWAH